MLFTNTISKTWGTQILSVLAVLALVMSAYVATAPNHAAATTSLDIIQLVCESGSPASDTCVATVCPLIDIFGEEAVENALPSGMTLGDLNCSDTSGGNDGDDETDVCPNDDGIQTDESECTPADNGGDDENNGGNDEDDNTPSDNSSNSSSGSRGGGGKRHFAGTNTSVSYQGEVLGAVTEVPSSCSALINSFMGLGKANNESDVVKLQSFLASELGIELGATGAFDAATKAAVEQFQLKYADQVLSPWVPFGLESASTPTGYVYKTTQRMINNVYCASLEIPMPQLP